MSEEVIKFYEAKLAAAKEIRLTYENTWAEIMDHFAPDLKGYLNSEKKDNGSRNDEIINDGDPPEYARKSAAGMWSTISSPSRPWMRRKLRKKSLSEIQEANILLDEMTECDYDILTDSNFYQEIFSVYMHYVSIGNYAMIIDPDYDTVIRCTTLNCGEYWLSVNGQGKVDTLFRIIEFSAAQLKDKFGEENLPRRVLNTITSRRPNGSDFKVVHVIAPDEKKIAPFKKPYVSVYFLESCHEKKFLQVRGYNRKPFSAECWFKLSGETYAKMSPGRNQLGNAKQLQQMVYDFNKALQMVIDPPLQGNTSAMENGSVLCFPGAWNPLKGALTASDGTIKPLYQINPQLDAMWTAIKEKKEQIAQGLFLDLFMAVSMRANKDMTAEEVRSISGEKALVLGPGLLNMHIGLNEILDIIYEYASEAGVYPEIPQSLLDQLGGQEIRIEYMSMLAQAQKLVDINRIDQLLFYIEKLSPIYPEIKDKADLDQVIDEVGKMTGAPARLIRPDDVVDQIRQDRAQGQQMQQMAQAATAAADVAQKASQMQMDQDTALTRFLGVQ